MLYEEGAVGAHCTGQFQCVDLLIKCQCFSLTYEVLLTSQNANCLSLTFYWPTLYKKVDPLACILPCDDCTVSFILCHVSLVLPPPFTMQATFILYMDHWSDANV